MTLTSGCSAAVVFNDIFIFKQLSEWKIARWNLFSESEDMDQHLTAFISEASGVQVRDCGVALFIVMGMGCIYVFSRCLP